MLGLELTRLSVIDESELRDHLEGSFSELIFYYIRKNSNLVLIAEKDIVFKDEILVNYRHHTYNKEYYE